MGCSIVCFLVHLKWTLAVSQGLKSLADSLVHSQTVALRRMCSFRMIDRTLTITLQAGCPPWEVCLQFLIVLKLERVNLVAI